MIQKTSIEAYNSILDSLGDRQVQVLRALQALKVANNRQIAEYLHLPINQTTPRCLELRSLRLVGVSHVAKDEKTNRQTIYWKVVGGLANGV